MKKLYFLPFLFSFAFFASAQDSWTVKLNNKILLVASKENEKATTKKIKVADLQKNGNLEILYKDKNNDKGWYRSFILEDEEGNEVMRLDTVAKLKISLKMLRKEFKGKKKIKVFTHKVPSDPDLAARVRVRRVLLCTLELP